MFFFLMRILKCILINRNTLIGKMVGLVLTEWQAVKLLHPSRKKNLTQVPHNSFLKLETEAKISLPTERHKNVTVDLRERQLQVCLLVDS